MIILDTHIWVWWIHGDDRLPGRYETTIQQSIEEGLGVSIISCWEIAKLVEYKKLVLPCPIEEWLKQALAHPGIRQLDLTPRIVVESTQLPPPFHRDPGDQFIVATARVFNCPLITVDTRILNYPYVQKVP